MTGRPSAGNRPILLLGPTGQVGWELARALGALAPTASAGRERADLADFDALRRCVRETRPSLIVNAAAYTKVDKAEEEPDLAMAVNGIAPGILAEEAKRLGVPLVHYSTDYVFDGHGATGSDGERRPYRESDPPTPVNVYGRSKLAGEQAIQAVGPVHLIFRTSWVYAARGANFLATIRRLAAEREELRIVDDQFGSPTWARAIADATARILSTGWARTLDRTAGSGPDDGSRKHAVSLEDAEGLYHMTAAGATTWCHFASAIVASDAAAGCSRTVPVKGITTSEYPLPARRPLFTVLDNSALKTTFGLQLPDWRRQLAACMNGDQGIKSHAIEP